MKNHKINYLLVGFFVLIMGVGLIAAVIMLSGRTGPSDNYDTVYDNVTDVKFGTQVLYEGYPIGQVERVVPFEQDGRMRFRVDLGVIADWKIPVDSVAQISSSGLLSPVAINIAAGDSPSSHPPGARITAGESLDLFSAMSSVASNVTDISEHGIKPLLNNLNTSVSGFSTMLQDDVTEVLSQVKALVAALNINAPKISGDLGSFTENLNAGSARLRELLSSTEPDQLSNTLDNMERIAANFANLSQDLNSSREQLDGILEGGNRIVKGSERDVVQSLESLRHVVDSLARHVDTINHNLDRTARNMNEFSERLKQNPGLLLGGGGHHDEPER